MSQYYKNISVWTGVKLNKNDSIPSKIFTYLIDSIHISSSSFSFTARWVADCQLPTLKASNFVNIRNINYLQNGLKGTTTGSIISAVSTGQGNTTNTHSMSSLTPQGYLQHSISNCLESFTSITIRKHWFFPFTFTFSNFSDFIHIRWTGWNGVSCTFHYYHLSFYVAAFCSIFTTDFWTLVCGGL